MSKKTHNYPTSRKPRDTSYSQTHKLIEQHGLEYIKQVGTEKGMYRAAGELEASPYVIRYIAHKHGGKRPASKAPAILKGVQNGHVSSEYFKGLDFSGLELQAAPPERKETK